MTDNELTLRDFDEESEETDSETELLIRHTVHNRSRGSASSNAANKTKNNNNGQRQRKSSTGYSGIGGPATIGVVGSGGAGVDVGGSSGSFLGNLFSLGSAAGQIRYRNERSRERAKYSNSNNIGSGRDSGSSASRDITSDQTKLAQLTHTGAGGVDSSKAASHPPHAEIGGAAPKGSISAHTVIDQENGASTVFYQNNRRRSKGRSLSNVCRMCFCRCVQSLMMILL